MKIETKYNVGDRVRITPPYGLNPEIRAAAIGRVGPIRNVTITAFAEYANISYGIGCEPPTKEDAWMYESVPENWLEREMP